jgi:ribose transport system permease protein
VSAEAVAAVPPRGQRAVAIARQYGIVWVTAALFVVLSIASDVFLSKTNLLNVLDQQSTILIVAAATTLTLIAGGFDVSLSAIYLMGGVTALRVENETGSIWMGVAAALAIGLGAGLVNGLVSTVGRINSFIATLATSFIFFGLAYVISDRSILRPDDASFSEIARTRVFDVALSSWIAIAWVIVLWLILDRTRYGRHVYASGGNAEAARLAGVRVSLVQLSTFALGGLAAGLAGVLVASRTSTAQASDDFSFIFSVIAAVVVGGTSILGGEGAVWRTVFGAFFIAFMINGFNLMGVDPVYQRIIQGAIILAAVAIDAWSRTRRR